MSITAIQTIKNWFKTDLIPTEEQFAAVFDSYRHKSEKVPLADVDGIDAALQNKASTATVNSHISDANAHSELFAKVRIVPIGDFIIIKRGTTTPDTLEPTDLVMGIVEGIWIFAIYNGGDKTLLENYSILNSQEF